VGDTCKARVLDATQSNLYVVDGTGSLQAQHATQDYFHELPQHATPEASKSSLPGN